MVTRGLALLCAMFALLPGASKGQGTQPSTSPKAAPGVSVTITPPPQPAPIDPSLSNYLRVGSVRILQLTRGNMAPVEFDLTPSTQKVISAFGVSLTAHYSDSTTFTTSLWEDELESTYRSSQPGSKTVRTAPWGGPLVYGEVRPTRASVRGNFAEGSLIYVDGQVTAVVFFDRTARGDSAVIQQIAAHRKAESEEKAAFLGNLRAALKDKGVVEAISRRSADVGDRFRGAFLAQPQPPDDSGKANRMADLNYLARTLASSQAGFDYLLGDREALQTLYAEHSLLKEGK